MKDIWNERYMQSIKMSKGDYLDILTGFNANIDVVFDVNDLNLNLEETEPKDLNKVENYSDFKSLLKFCMNEGENKEVKRQQIDGINLEKGEKTVGGQGAIMANYLSNMNNSVVFYTPFLSQELTDKLNDDILYPVIDDQFVLKNIKDASNTDRTKKNLIFEFSEDETGRLILSDRIKGFGPYFRGGVEDNFYKMDKNLDRVLLSGFHNIEGNKESKLEKSREQLNRINAPIHLEYVSMSDSTAKPIMKKIFSEIDSIGCDEFEARQLAKLNNIDISGEQLKIKEAYKVAKKIIEKYNISRFHLHSYKYHLVVTEEDYNVDREKIRDSMLFGSISAIAMANKGRIPEEKDLNNINWDEIHLKRLDELEDFEHEYDLDKFVEKGHTHLEEYNVVAIPSLIHEDPKRLVGMGDIISSGAFIGELK